MEECGKCLSGHLPVWLGGPTASHSSTQEMETGALVGAHVVMTGWKGVETNVLVAQTSLGHAQPLARLPCPLAPWQRPAKLIQRRGHPTSIAWSSSWSFWVRRSPHCLTLLCSVHLHNLFSKLIAHMWASVEPVGRIVGLWSDAGQEG